ncbi:trehalose operon repressor [Staphylococcus durrellii]|uniref:trehalose operon repressor n=1 Tax=Staphylococcus durrellii TaxID=2781773 RepID=UPI0018A1012F|nr:trehalose operon repressor [Staphylococcus durrellii]MBF7017929.1 trehalose operon repressor [Staphylococcus durrellii]
MSEKKFVLIYEKLKDAILSEELTYGDRIPSEHDLVERYQASRETVRKALNLLVGDGMIQKIRGKGSVVIYQNITEFPFADLMSFSEVKNELQLQYKTKVIRFEKIKADEVPFIKEQLGIKANARLWYIVRLRMLNDKVKIIDEDYLVADIVPNITIEHARASIYHYIEHILDLEISYSNKAITFEPFGDLEYEQFGDVAPPYTATVRGIVHLKNTERFQYNISKHLATEFRFNDFSRRRKL